MYIFAFHYLLKASLITEINFKRKYISLSEFLHLFITILFEFSLLVLALPYYKVTVGLETKLFFTISRKWVELWQKYRFFQNHGFGIKENQFCYAVFIKLHIYHIHSHQNVMKYAVARSSTLRFEYPRIRHALPKSNQRPRSHQWYSLWYVRKSTLHCLQLYPLQEKWKYFIV